MVVYVTYRGPVEVELDIETGEIIDVHVLDEKVAQLDLRLLTRAAASSRLAWATR